MKQATVTLILLLGILPLLAQVDVQARLDTTRILIGDQVSLTMTLAHPPGVRITGIDWAALDKQPAIEVVDPGKLDTVATRGDVVLTQTLKLTSFDSGYFQIPPVPVHYIAGGKAGTVQSNELALEVYTFPIAADTAALAPIKTIIEEPLEFRDFLPYLLLALAVALLAGFIAYFLRRSRHRAVEPPPPPRPAHEVAREDLAALRAAKLWQQGKIKDFQTELTRIVRQYLELRFDLPALESTTEEIVARLRRLDLDDQWPAKLQEMLQTADLVKFAKAIPPVTIHEQMLDRAEAFVEATIPKEEAEEAEEPSGEEAETSELPTQP